MKKSRSTQLPTSIPFEYIPLSHREMTDTCLCGDITAYRINGSSYCLVCAEQRYPTLYHPLPDDIKVEIHLDPIGQERYLKERYQNVENLFCYLHVGFMCRVLPGTENATTGYIRSEGLTCAGVLARIRDLVYDWNKPYPPKHIIISNFGFSIYTNKL